MSFVPNTELQKREKKRNKAFKDLIQKNGDIPDIELSSNLKGLRFFEPGIRDILRNEKDKCLKDKKLFSRINELVRGEKYYNSIQGPKKRALITAIVRCKPFKFEMPSSYNMVKLGTPSCYLGLGRESLSFPPWLSSRTQTKLLKLRREVEHTYKVAQARVKSSYGIAIDP